MKKIIIATAVVLGLTGCVAVPSYYPATYYNYVPAPVAVPVPVAVPQYYPVPRYYPAPRYYNYYR